jgi:cytochrome c-type biogenesis protein CcmH
MTRLLLALAIALAAPAFADSSMPAARWSDRQLPDPAKEAAARSLMDEVRCLVCEGQSVGDSDAELAGDMRHLIRERIAAGEKPSQIRAWLIERYGNAITYSPPVEPLTWPLWIAPLALLAGGLFLLRRRIRIRRSG